MKKRKVPVDRWAEEKILQSEASIQKQLHPHRDRFVFWISSTLIGVVHLVLVIVLLPLLIVVNMFLLGIILAITALVSGLLYHSSISGMHLHRHHHVTATFFIPLILGIYVAFIASQSALLPQQVVSAGLITGMMFSVPRLLSKQDL